MTSSAPAADPTVVSVEGRVEFIDNPRAAVQEWTALSALLALGVTLGEPECIEASNVASEHSGTHYACDFHLYDEHGNEFDGGCASAIASNARHGYYDPLLPRRPRLAGYTLRRVLTVPDAKPTDETASES